MSYFRAVVSVIVIAFLSLENYFITGFYSYFYSYGLLLTLNDDDDDGDDFNFRFIYFRLTNNWHVRIDQSRSCCQMLVNFDNYFTSATGAEYCDEHVCLSVCTVCLCLPWCT